jgi:hypothetical protein
MEEAAKEEAEFVILSGDIIKITNYHSSNNTY